MNYDVKLRFVDPELNNDPVCVGWLKTCEEALNVFLTMHVGSIPKVLQSKTATHTLGELLNQIVYLPHGSDP